MSAGIEITWTGELIINPMKAIPARVNTLFWLELIFNPCSPLRSSRFLRPEVEKLD